MVEEGLVETVFFPRCISDEKKQIYGVVLLVLVTPACALAALVWPAWLLSLQLGVALATDAVDDVMLNMGPRAASMTYAQDEQLWKRKVELPTTLLHSTMRELSQWGFAMGIAACGCWLFTAGLLPTVVAMEEYGGQGTKVLLGFGLVTVAALPPMIALAPANVSTACDEL